MKKLILITLSVLVLSGCGMTPQEKDEKKEECIANGLAWSHDEAFGQRIYCTDWVGAQEHPDKFRKCAFDCEKLFHEQANTWSNGSESQSISANECLNICLTNS